MTILCNLESTPLNFLSLSQRLSMKVVIFHEANNVLFFWVTFKTALTSFFIVTSGIYVPRTYVIIKNPNFTYCQPFISITSYFSMLRLDLEICRQVTLHSLNMLYLYIWEHIFTYTTHLHITRTKKKNKT